jgi:hypothetical protein
VALIFTCLLTCLLSCLRSKALIYKGFMYKRDKETSYMMITHVGGMRFEDVKNMRTSYPSQWFADLKRACLVSLSPFERSYA